MPLTPVVYLGESRVVCATWLTLGAWHSPADTRQLFRERPLPSALPEPSAALLPSGPVCCLLRDTHLRGGTHQTCAVGLRLCAPLQQGPGAVPRGRVPPERPACVNVGAPLCSACVLEGQALLILTPCPSTPPLFQSRAQWSYVGFL